MFMTVTTALMEGFVESLKVFSLTLLFALPLGLLICFGSMNKWAPLRCFSRKQNSFVEKFRKRSVWSLGPDGEVLTTGNQFTGGRCPEKFEGK